MSLILFFEISVQLSSSLAQIFPSSLKNPHHAHLFFTLTCTEGSGLGKSGTPLFHELKEENKGEGSDQWVLIDHLEAPPCTCNLVKLSSENLADSLSSQEKLLIIWYILCEGRLASTWVLSRKQRHRHVAKCLGHNGRGERHCEG